VPWVYLAVGCYWTVDESWMAGSRTHSITPAIGLRFHRGRRPAPNRCSKTVVGDAGLRAGGVAQALVSRLVPLRRNVGVVRWLR